MPYLPILPETNPSQQMTDAFGGYNHNLKIGDGEFYDMENLTSSYYPLMANREPRGKEHNFIRCLLVKLDIVLHSWLCNNCDL